MKDFNFNEVCGLPVSFDKNITEETEWFALRARGERTTNAFLHQAGFDKTKEGKWISTILRGEHGEFIEFDSMKDVVEAICWWHKINKDSCFRNVCKQWNALFIANDTLYSDDWD